jgi:hypothetical protein
VPIKLLSLPKISVIWRFFYQLPTSSKEPVTPLLLIFTICIIVVIMKERKIELLSPVGSFECLQAAIKGGADAVYFGVEQLNMRAKSVNSLSVNDIQQITAICKANGIKSYITLNTVMYD